MTNRRGPSYDTALVFAAACAAQRVNGEYLKHTAVNDAAGTSRLANKVLIHGFLKGDYDIRDEDREQAPKVMQMCNALTFKLLSDKKLNEFEQSMLTIAEKTTIDSNYDIAVVCSLPASYERSVVRNTVQHRLDETEGFVGEAGDKVSVSAEVARCNFSKQWHPYFVTAITDDNKQIFFAYHNKIEVGAKINVEGRIKAQRKNATQLNYVKIV